MKVLRGKCLLCMLVVLQTAAIAGAMPTIGRCDIPCGFGPAGSYSDLTFFARENIIGPALPILATVATHQSNDCPANSLAANCLLYPQAQSLPPVPSAILLVLTGFLCVSLIRDRRVYITTLVAVVSLVHVGIRTLPDLAERFCYKRHVATRHSAGLVSHDHSLGRFFMHFHDRLGKNLSLAFELGGEPARRRATGDFTNQNYWLVSRNDRACDHASSARTDSPRLLTIALESQFVPLSLVAGHAPHQRSVYSLATLLYPHLSRGPPRLT